MRRNTENHFIDLNNCMRKVLNPIGIFTPGRDFTAASDYILQDREVSWTQGGWGCPYYIYFIQNKRTNKSTNINNHPMG